MNIWDQVLSNLKSKMTNATFETWLRQSVGDEEDGTLSVRVVSHRAKEILDNRLRSTIERELYQVVGQPMELAFVVDRNINARANNGRTPPPSAAPSENIFDLLSTTCILKTNWPEPVWVVPGSLPQGLTILAGKPKLGKSWLALQLAQAVSTGGNIFNQTVEQGNVLYLALEDPPRRLQDRMKRQVWTNTASADFMVLGNFDSQIGDLGSGGSEILAQQIRLKKYRLVIIDTFSRSISGDQKDSELMTAALDPLQEIAHSHHCAVMLIDHHSKAKNMATMDVVSDIFGSVAKGAMVDTAWGFYRDPGVQGAFLAITGREVNEQKIRLSMNWETGIWQTEGGTTANLEMTHRRQEVYDALKVLGQSSLSEIAAAIDQDRGNTYRRLQDLINAGLATKTDENGHIVYEAIGN